MKTTGSERATGLPGPLRLSRYWRLGVWAFLFFLLKVAGASAGPFEEHWIGVKGKINDVQAYDLDADGTKEMVVSSTVYHGMRMERELRVYSWSGTGFSLQKAWKVDPEAVFWDVGPAGDGSGRKHCFFLSWNGLWELCETESGKLVPEHRLDAPVFVANGQEDAFVWMDFIRDWRGKGGQELFVPLVREGRFYEPSGKGDWQEVDSVELAPASAYNNSVMFGRNLGSYQYLSVSFFPLTVPADLNGDGSQDLLVFRQGTAHCFFRGPDGKLGSEAVLWAMDIRSPEEKIHRRASLSFRVADLNRDGCADVVVHKVGVSFGNWSAETAIFLGTREGDFPTEPYQRFALKGFFSGMSVQDLDGDGYEDLSLWSVKMGLWPIVEILLRKVVHVVAEDYYADWPAGFPSTSDSLEEHELRIDPKKVDHLQGLVPNTSGDFTGDGVSDMVASRTEDTIGIYQGRKRKGFSSRPWATLRAQGVSYVITDDLNSDGRCDLYGFKMGTDNSSLHLWAQTDKE